MILVFGGTSDSIKLMDGLLSKDYDAVISVATAYGKTFSRNFGDRVIQKRLNQVDMVEFIKKNSVELILDASHPFADIVSSNAIAAAESTHIPYVRFERPRLKYPKEVVRVSSIQEACLKALEVAGNIYLTTGSKSMKEYLDYLPVERVIARVLPVAEVIESMENLGLNAGQIHAIKGPFTMELNKELYKMSEATSMITKESGQSGGVDTKIRAALESGIAVFLIERPYVEYPEQYHTINEVIERVDRLYEK
ncbi:precorrin-6A reductase [Suicoccus acidiformans]|uniref:Precorrin-6A reductase n=1 Tax=Suicoccus acidiformans TaxID=2036206 RepID=A0A347WM13_9LACT|nr:precorrin-6A reductase [Suicoccus acidiformans]AXY26120.1 precorrin-6A reductase [Suicoccus acidiformans]